MSVSARERISARIRSTWLQEGEWVEPGPVADGPVPVLGLEGIQRSCPIVKKHIAFVVLQGLSTNMSKRKKSGKVKSRKRRTTSSLQQHSRIGKTLLPPFLTLPGSGLTPISWMNDRLPEMLWACLVISVIPRHVALDLFREVAAIGFKFRDNEASAEWGLTHSHLAELPEEILTQVIQIITRHPLGYACLRPLLILDKLPGKERWKLLLRTDPQEGDWSTLSNAVLVTLDHQSQESTDVRWLRILFMIALGRIHFPQTMKERIEEIVHYPNRGDMRSVRPSIRAMEIGFVTSGGAKNAQTAWHQTSGLSALCERRVFQRKSPGPSERNTRSKNP